MNSLADRLVNLVAPKATAGACIPPDPYTASCGCKSSRIYAKSCSNNCAGTVFCGSCYATSIVC
jgi:hypothetical protein